MLVGAAQKRPRGRRSKYWHKRKKMFQKVSNYHEELYIVLLEPICLDFSHGIYYSRFFTKKSELNGSESYVDGFPSIFHNIRIKGSLILKYKD